MVMFVILVFSVQLISPDYLLGLINKQRKIPNQSDSDVSLCVCTLSLTGFIQNSHCSFSLSTFIWHFAKSIYIKINRYPFASLRLENSTTDLANFDLERFVEVHGKLADWKTAEKYKEIVRKKGKTAICFSLTDNLYLSNTIC